MKNIGIVLDSNYFLHFKGPEFIPWKDLVGEGEIHLLITDPLTKELDRQKNNKTGKIKERAEKAIKSFYLWFENGDEYTLRPDLILRTLDLFNIEFEQHQLSKDEADDWFLAYALDISDKKIYEEVILVTNDFGVHNKARKRKIKTLRLDEAYRLPDFQSESDKEINALKNQLLKFQNRQPKLKVLYADGKDVIEQKIVEVSPFSEGDVEILKHHLMSNFSYALKGKNEKKEITRIELEKEVTSEAVHNFKAITEGFSALVGLMAPTQEQLKQYDEDLDEYFLAKIKYELDKRAFEAKEARSVRFKLSITNEGTAKATGIKLNMYFPVSKACKLLTLESFENSRPKEPIAPVYPKHKFFTGSEYLANDLFIPRLHHSLIEPASNVSSPRITPTNSFNVEIEVEDLLHTQADFIDEMILIFPTVEEAASFSISYSLICPEIVEPIEGQLHVKIEK